MDQGLDSVERRKRWLGSRKENRSSDSERDMPICADAIPAWHCEAIVGRGFTRSDSWGNAAFLDLVGPRRSTSFLNIDWSPMVSLGAVGGVRRFAPHDDRTVFFAGAGGGLFRRRIVRQLRSRCGKFADAGVQFGLSARNVARLAMAPRRDQRPPHIERRAAATQFRRDHAVGWSFVLAVRAAADVLLDGKPGDVKDAAR